jgi:hypothetical protein
MKTIRDILDRLTPAQKDKLKYAFEHQLSQYVEYEPGKYVGVNTGNAKNLSVEQCAGSYYAGDLKVNNSSITKETK